MLDPTVIANRTEILDCPAVGIPPPKLTWYKDGIPLDLSSLRHIRLLQVKNMSKSYLEYCKSADKHVETRMNSGLFHVILPFQSEEKCLLSKLPGCNLFCEILINIRSLDILLTFQDFSNVLVSKACTKSSSFNCDLGRDPTRDQKGACRGYW